MNIEKVYSLFNLQKADDRRMEMNLFMGELVESGVDCMSCEGFCCTYAHNSMQATPLEALELFFYIVRKNRWNEELVSELKQNIKQFRLDYDISTGNGTSLRRYYTCPFFKEKRCEISPSYKPYGCLAFNPLKAKVEVEGECESNLDLLKEREDKFFAAETLANDYIKNELKLYWDKLPIALALIEIESALN